MKLLKSFVIFIIIFLAACSIDDRDPDLLELSLNPGIDTLNVGDTYQDAGATALIGNDPHDYQVIKNTIDTNHVGSYEIIYQSTFKTKTITIKRYVDVVDEIPAQLTLNPGIDTVKKGTNWIDAGIQIEDNSNLETSLEIEGYVNINQVGEYMIKYIVTDAYDNQSFIIRYVYVIE